MKSLARRALRDKSYRRRLSVQGGLLIDALWTIAITIAILGVRSILEIETER